MKILVCAHDKPDYINGPNIWLRRLLPELRKKGVEGRLLFFPGGDPDRCPSILALREDGFSCDVYAGPPHTELRIPWILEKVRWHEPDVFIPNLDIPAYHTSAGVREMGIPVVGVLHSDDPFYRAVAEEFLERPDPSPLNAMVVVSRFLEELCEKKTGPETFIRRIPYGIPIPSESASFDQGLFRLVYAGRLVEPQKRISEVATALCRATREVRETEAVLYGSGGAEADVQAILRKSGADREGRVRLGGLVENKVLQTRLLESQAFVLLSDFEGLPIALMEAMACGLVPICSEMRSGIPELIRHEENGLVVPNRGDAFVEAVRRLKSDPELWVRLSRAARTRVVSEFSVPASADRWESLLQEVRRRQQGSSTNHRFRMPRRLPPRHPDIRITEDPRTPGYSRRLYRRLRRLVQRITR